MLPCVQFCGLNVTRLILGANPFAGYSHQNPQRDREMLAYHTVARIRETWERAESAGINTIVTNNTTPHVVQAVREYRAAGGALQWIAQVAFRDGQSMDEAIDEAVQIGCRAMYFHGGAGGRGLPAQGRGEDPRLVRPRALAGRAGRRGRPRAAKCIVGGRNGRRGLPRRLLLQLRQPARRKRGASSGWATSPRRSPASAASGSHASLTRSWARAGLIRAWRSSTPSRASSRPTW